MAFTVINAVRRPKEEIASIVMGIQQLGLDELRDHPGFRSSRLIVSEDEQEAMLILEWDSRDHFIAYRQSELGQRMVQGASQWHPQIGFFNVLAGYDAT
jgi:heme-degrading monooxygenase HmoA